MILAGYETTANALGFTMYLLAGHPECQSRLVAEVDAVLGGSKHPGYQDLDKLPYMDACLREALRYALPTMASADHAREPTPSSVSLSKIVVRSCLYSDSYVGCMLAVHVGRTHPSHEVPILLRWECGQEQQQAHNTLRL